MLMHAQVVIGLGLLAATGYAVQRYVAPRVSTWVREWLGRPDADAARAAAEAERERAAQAVASAIAAQVRACPWASRTPWCCPHQAGSQIRSIHGLLALSVDCWLAIMIVMPFIM